MNNNFSHQHTAHCESGVMSTLLKSQGVNFNEAMVFGLASALTFVYIPLIKISGMPLISYRMPPGAMLKKVSKVLKGKLALKRFRSPQQGQQALDKALAQGKLVGLQTSVFWLPYFPPEMRFHFNAHNLLVYGKQENEYLISDPVFEQVQRCAVQDLQRARFAKGALAAKGLMYYWKTSPNLTALDLPTILRKAIRKNAKQMLAPFWFVGVRGMFSLAKQIEKFAHSKQSEKYKKLFLGHIVRMQEEIGTGGAGFRYIYAYFLEQAAEICQEPNFKQASQQMTEIGDQWRQFASLCVKQCRQPSVEGYQEIAKFLNAVAEKEATLWRMLKNQ
ncbi:BtrH N-terminal domain-containing protein [Avibacterium sp. 20-15]|uniref:BtrH N-terminal domain-containing protein n=1 Tax=unclassified Avibacterium TaxID=2685287 RepID=UPI002026FC20|nr:MULTISPECIES: BtrH N-terminal domain-containing protein [unclassified Avibacterium]MCW9732705.1 BtrH N-terminal domain-containing protein [Avibacterium sp. 20-15]URL04852.1 BtrH N-terminal domain-containing protein [Avibacterium sp. 20-132]